MSQSPISLSQSKAENRIFYAFDHSDAVVEYQLMCTFNLMGDFLASMI